MKFFLGGGMILDQDLNGKQGPAKMMGLNLQNVNLSILSWELTYPFPKALFEDDYLFPRCPGGYFSKSLEKQLMTQWFHVILFRLA